MDKCLETVPILAMGKSDKTPFHFGNPVVNLILTALAFLFFLWILRPHVPAQTEIYRWIFATLPATALTLTFYLCLAMYRVTINDHKKRKNQNYTHAPPGSD